MAGTVPELTPAVPCPGLTRICTGIVCYCANCIAHKFTTDNIRHPLSCCVTSTWRSLCVGSADIFIGWICRSRYFSVYSDYWDLVYCVSCKMWCQIVLVQCVCEKFVVQVSSQLSWQGIVRQAEPLLVGSVGDAGKTPTWQLVATKKKK